MVVIHSNENFSAVILTPVNGVMSRNINCITEHFGVDIIDVDLIAASLENAFSTTGGFCAGRSYVIGHQRLSGLGYCFSASLPPLLAAAASEALNIIQEHPEIFERLRLNAVHLHQTLKCALEGSRFELFGIDISPIKFIGYENENAATAEETLDAFVNELHDCNVFVTRARYLLDEELFPQNPTVKVMCRSDLTYEEIDQVGRKMSEMMTKFQSNDRCEIIE